MIQSTTQTLKPMFGLTLYELQTLKGLRDVEQSKNGDLIQNSSAKFAYDFLINEYQKIGFPLLQRHLGFISNARKISIFISFNHTKLFGYRHKPFHKWFSKKCADSKSYWVVCDWQPITETIQFIKRVYVIAFAKVSARYFFIFAKQQNINIFKSKHSVDKVPNCKLRATFANPLAVIHLNDNETLST